MNTQKEKILHLSLIKGIGPATLQKIVDSGVPLSKVYRLSAHELYTTCGIPQKMANLLVSGLSDRSLLEKELVLLEKYPDIQVVCFSEPEYPELLAHIPYPPLVLYVRGILPTTKKAIAFVGSRKAQRYARRFLELVIPDIVGAGWSVVSGGAYGADTMAHEVTLTSGGTTIAVLGSGLLRPYPRENSSLFKKIRECGGSIISSFPLTTQPAPGNFPARNRIISGLSAGCVVVQAAQKSGALITAYSALEQGRSIFAVPGAFDDELSQGCFRLIQEGASLATSSKDILQILDPLHTSQIKIEVSKQVQLPQQEQKVFDCCTQPTSIDELIEKTGLSLGDIMTLTFELQLKGVVRQHVTGLWEQV